MWNFNCKVKNLIIIMVFLKYIMQTGHICIYDGMYIWMYSLLKSPQPSFQSFKTHWIRVHSPATILATLSHNLINNIKTLTRTTILSSDWHCQRHELNMFILVDTVHSMILRGVATIWISDMGKGKIRTSFQWDAVHCHSKNQHC